MRIIKVEDGITWKDFRTKYRKFFRISYEPKALEVMGKEYKRLTGREPVDEKPKKLKNVKVNIVDNIPVVTPDTDTSFDTDDLH